MRLLVAEFEGRALAMIFVTAFGDEAIYLYGASGNEERNRMPGCRALHWAAIQWAKAKGCVRYDLWGVPENAGGIYEEAEDCLPRYTNSSRGLGERLSSIRARGMLCLVR